MAELKIIGVKRVEALLNVLGAKEKAAISALSIPSLSDITAMVDAEFGITETRSEVDKLKSQLEEKLAELNDTTGETRYVSYSYNHRSNMPKFAYRERYEELTKLLRDKPLADLKQAFEAKRTQLWMCETLEEAKAIVGVA